jgi:hypothetical protein
MCRPNLGWLKAGTFHLCLSFLASFLKITQREFNDDYMRFLNLSHLDTLLLCVSSPWCVFPHLKQLLFFPYHLKVDICGAHG